MYVRIWILCLSFVMIILLSCKSFYPSMCTMVVTEEELLTLTIELLFFLVVELAAAREDAITITVYKHDGWFKDRLGRVHLAEYAYI